MAAVGEQRITYDARGLAEPHAEAPRTAKIEDGNLARRAGDVVTIATLRQLGLVTDPLAGPLVDYAAPPIVDPRGASAGDVQAVFRLS